MDDAPDNASRTGSDTENTALSRIMISVEGRWISVSMARN